MNPGEELIRLLASKNKFLEKMLEQSEGHLQKVNFNDVQSFVQFQALNVKIPRILDLYQNKIKALAEKVTPAEKTEAWIKTVQSMEQAHVSLVRAILEVDQRFIRKIQSEKDLLIEEAKEAEQGSTQIKKFKSQWLDRLGESIDGKV